MAKQQTLLLLAATAAAALLLPMLACAAREVGAATGFVVEGRVFCDTCRFGYETPLSTYVAGAKVRVECKSKATGAKTCSFEGETDHSGTYKIPVRDEHEHETCESVLVSGPQGKCGASMVQGRERASVFLTRNNGIASDTRFANALGFQTDTPLAECSNLLKLYQQYEV